MELSGNAGARPACAAAELAKLVDEQINGCARAEFADATDELQESGADLGKGSEYLDDGPIFFTEQTVACGLCQGTARLSFDGSVEARRCPISGSCELEWAQRYPENYRDADGGPSAGRLVCGAEIDCTAQISLLSDDGQPTLAFGICQLAERGGNWQQRRDDAIKHEPCSAPGADVEVFDGAGSGREED